MLRPSASNEEALSISTLTKVLDDDDESMLHIADENSSDDQDDD